MEKAIYVDYDEALVIEIAEKHKKLLRAIGDL